MIPSHIPVIKSYKPHHTYSQHTLFIQSKGQHSGRPLKDPIPNCFAVLCSSSDEYNYWYWMSFGLWKSKTFQMMLRGSVIPFITIDTCKKLFERGLQELGDKIDLNAQALQKLHELEIVTQRKLQAVQQMQMTLIRLDPRH